MVVFDTIFPKREKRKAKSENRKEKIERKGRKPNGMQEAQK